MKLAKGKEVKDDNYWMSLALEQARFAQEAGEVPIGAVMVREGELLATGWNQPISKNDPTEHAEINCLRDAAKQLGNYRLPDCDLYVTLEPCAMCAGALVHARIRRLIFGATEPRAGAVVSQVSLLETDWMNHRVEVLGGVMAEQCAQVLKDFFKARR
jgi:tRNA(adenine34) deaminase